MQPLATWLISRILFPVHWCFSYVLVKSLANHVIVHASYKCIELIDTCNYINHCFRSVFWFYICIVVVYILFVLL